MQMTSIRFFDNKEIRAVWNDENSQWYFSVLDKEEESKQLLEDAKLAVEREIEGEGKEKYDRKK